MAIIEVEDLHKSYGGGPEVVKGVSFTVGESEVFGLLGPNGAGKTTTIGTLTTRVKPTSGSVTVDGIDVRRDPTAVKQRIAVVPQRPNLDRSISARENLTFHAAYFGYSRAERSKRADELLEQFGLEGREDDRVDFYSGGMAQRLMIARALMHRPRILFLDEPTTGLDPQSRLFLWDAIERLRGEGTTILLTTHDMAEADRLCERIAIVDHGERIAMDTPRGLRGLLPAADGMELTLTADEDPGPRLAALGNVETAKNDDGTWTVRCFGDSSPREALAAVDEAGAELVDLRRLEGSLEDVFVHLTGRDLR